MRLCFFFYLCVFITSFQKVTSSVGVKKKSIFKPKVIYDDWKISNHEKNINRHSWILVPEEKSVRFKRTVPFNQPKNPPTTLYGPYKDEAKNQNNSIPITNESHHTTTSSKKKKYHRLAHSVNVQSDIRYR